MVKIKGFFQKLGEHRKIGWFLLLLILPGIFLRTFHYSDWMHFELDQARDVLVVYDFFEKGEIPLVGPYARGSDLFLGPIFYYFQIASVFLFDFSPESVAWPDILFSILFLPLLYFFLRLFFSRSISLATTSLATVSLFLVTYGRFAWNPNSLPFWTVFSLYALLRCWDGRKLYFGWFLTAVGGLAVTMQLHFIAFFTLPFIFLIYGGLVRMKIDRKSFLVGFALLAIIFLPLIVYEGENAFSNTKALFSTVSSKKNKDNEHNLAEKFFRAYQETGTYNVVLLSGVQSGRENIRTKAGGKDYFICDKDCRRQLPLHLTGIFFLTLFIFLFFRQLFFLWKNRNNSFEAKRQFQSMLLVALWMIWAGIFLVLMAYQISPRFFLFLAPLFLFSFGFLGNLLIAHFNRKGLAVFLVIFFLLFFSNLHQTIKFSRIIDSVEKTSDQSWRDLILARNDYVTLGQLRKVADWVTEKGETEFVVVGDNRYARALYFLINIERKNKLAKCYAKFSGFEKTAMTGENLFVLARSKSSDHLVADLTMTHQMAGKKVVGTLTIYQMKAEQSAEERVNLPSGCFLR